ncbi:MAG TPA: transporter substrate-binding domain-containing protein [Tianweitania sediminis]|jgi:polar amino acid transport system substrate-binding protein|nr:transporter substrate-binding domain-containing protein [Tianweitania sediminis]
MLRTFARSFLLCCGLLAGAPGFAAEPILPNLWDPKERMPKPDLGEVERLRFITTTEFPPFNFIDETGRLSGFHVDLARAICAELAITDRCQIQALPWDEHRQALEDGEGEALLAGLAVTEENRRTLAFSRPYMVFPARFMAQRTDLVEPTAENLAGRTVGVMAGSAHERMLRDLFPGVTVQGFDDFEAMLAAVQTGMIPLAFGDGMQISFWLGESESANCCSFVGGPFIAPEYLGQGLAVAVPLDQPVLRQAIDYALHQISAKGTFAELYLRYFPIGFF